MKSTFHIHIHTGSECCSELRAEQTTPITSGLTPPTTIRSDTKVGHALYPTNVCVTKAQNTKPVGYWGL